MTLLNKLVDYVDVNEAATDIEIANALNTNKKIVQTYLRRLANRKILQINKDNGVRIIKVLEIPEIKPEDYKRGVFEMMVDKYLEDFKSAEFFRDRVEIGKMVIRILEKL